MLLILWSLWLESLATPDFLAIVMAFPSFLERFTWEILLYAGIQFLVLLLKITTNLVLKTAQMYHLIALEVQKPKWVSLIKIKVSAGCSFWRLWKRSCFLDFSIFLEAACIPQLMDPFLHLQSQPGSISLTLLQTSYLIFWLKLENSLCF